MLNKVIELVKKWIADPKSVSQDELEANSKSAWAEYRFADYDVWAAACEAADYAAHSPLCRASAARWVKRYEQLINNKGGLLG